MKTYKTKYLSIKHPLHSQLIKNANFSASGSIKGMKNKYYGKNASLIKSGSYIYNVSCDLDLYEAAH